MMFKMSEITPCAEDINSITAECTYLKTEISFFEKALYELDFKTVKLGSPEVVVAKRDGMVFIVAEDKLTASRVKNKDILIDTLDILSKKVELILRKMEKK